MLVTGLVREHEQTVRAGAARCAQLRRFQGVSGLGPKTVMPEVRHRLSVLLIVAALAGAVHSRTVDQGVFATLSLASTATFAVSGDTETFSGQVLPDHGGQRVLLQRLAGGAWRTLAKPRLRPDSSFATSFKFIKSGRQQ